MLDGTRNATRHIQARGNHAAGLAHGSFYTYFDSKEDVFRQVADRVVRDVYGALEGYRFREVLVWCEALP